ncbi:hypothetical protein ACFL1R_00715 [Candidatus Latescibacterota bacterium]
MFKWDKEELAKYNVIGSGWDEEDFVERNPNKVFDITGMFFQLYNPVVGFQNVSEGFKNSKPMPLDTDWENAEE